MNAGTLAIVAATACIDPCVAQTVEAPLSTRVDAEEGEYLVAGNGFAIYLFKADTRGNARSECEGECLAAWPPVLVDGASVGDQNIRDELLGTMTRTDAMLQLTYNGWPLYFYAEDYDPGAVNGHDINDFGEDWYLIGPDGERPRD